MQSVVLHEFGHCFGLCDLYGDADLDKVMFGGRLGLTSPPIKRSLAPEDIAGIQYIYPGEAPTVATNSASDITFTSATLNGDLTSLGTATYVYVSFEYGTTTNYGEHTGPLLRTSQCPFDTAISGLSPNTTYHYIAKAEGDGTSYGIDQHFTTDSFLDPPYGTTEPATVVTDESATLNGNLTDLGTAGTVCVSFEYGLDINYGSNTAPEEMTDVGTFDAPISGLSQNATYHFRAKAVGDGTSYGSDQYFTTEPDETAPAAVTDWNFTIRQATGWILIKVKTDIRCTWLKEIFITLITWGRVGRYKRFP